MQISGANDELGKNQFLELMVAQLQYQDPLEPVSNQDFLAQLAQFSVVEGVDELNLQFKDSLKLETLGQGAGLIGKNVEYQDEITGDIIRGRVEETRLINGQLNLLVGEKQVPLVNINAVIANDAA